MDVIKYLTILSLTLTSIISCSVLGNKIGKSLDSESTGTKYEDKYTEKGAEADVAIIKAIFFREEEEPEIDTRACKEPNTQQICTVKKGCWCEKT